MRKRTAGMLALVALLAGACGSADKTTSTATIAGTGPQTLPIGVDARTDAFASSWTHFFPHEVRAHPGDTLEFTSHFTGEPHTVAFGTLIDEYVAANARVDPDSAGPPPPDVKAVLDKVPLVFNDGGGPDDLFVQAASQPCYLAAGDPPTRQACSKDDQVAPREITGKERFLNTGFLPEEKAVSFKLAADMAPGRYTFICLVHGPEMSEVVTVVDKATAVPGPDEVAAEGRMHLDEFLAEVGPLADKVRSSTSAQAQVGTHVEDEAIPSAGINVVPSEIAVRAGEKVTWTVDGFHTIAFNAPEDARPWLQFDDSGALAANKKSFTPTASPPIPVPPEPAARDGGGGGGGRPQLRVDAGAWDGQGFHSSGAVISRGQLVYSLAFSKPGTYRYRCLVHPDMEGIVKVT